MSVPPISSATSAPQANVLTTPKGGTAPDGDPAAVEAAESSKTKLAEAANGGFAPPQSATPAKGASSTTSVVFNKKV